MRKWHVRLHQSFRNGKSKRLQWIVDPPGYDAASRAEHTGHWHTDGGKRFRAASRGEMEAARLEALAYARRMARTMRVALPQIETGQVIASKYDATNEPPVIVQSRGRMTWITQRGDAGEGLVILDIDQLKPVALDLLARHCRNVRSNNATH